MRQCNLSEDCKGFRSHKSRCFLFIRSLCTEYRDKLSRDKRKCNKYSCKYYTGHCKDDLYTPFFKYRIQVSLTSKGKYKYQTCNDRRHCYRKIYKGRQNLFPFKCILGQTPCGSQAEDRIYHNRPDSSLNGKKGCFYGIFIGNRIYICRYSLTESSCYYIYQRQNQKYDQKYKA